MKEAQRKITLQEEMELNRTEKKSFIRKVSKHLILPFKYSHISVPEINIQFIPSKK